MPDLEDVAAEVKEKLTIVPVKKITDVLKAEKSWHEKWEKDTLQLFENVIKYYPQLNRELWYNWKRHMCALLTDNEQHTCVFCAHLSGYQEDVNAMHEQSAGT